MLWALGWKSTRRNSWWYRNSVTKFFPDDCVTLNLLGDGDHRCFNTIFAKREKKLEKTFLVRTMTNTVTFRCILHILSNNIVLAKTKLLTSFSISPFIYIPGDIAPQTGVVPQTKVWSSWFMS